MLLNPHVTDYWNLSLPNPTRSCWASRDTGTIQCNQHSTFWIVSIMGRPRFSRSHPKRNCGLAGATFLELAPSRTVLHWSMILLIPIKCFGQGWKPLRSAKPFTYKSKPSPFPSHSNSGNHQKNPTMVENVKKNSKCSLIPAHQM